jgi:SecD/SecF fusion protein
MPASFKWRIPLVLVVLAAAAWYAFPLSKRINLGLDLQGGMHLVLRLETSKVPQLDPQQDATALAIEVIRNRIDRLGVREPLIQRQGRDHILVQLPGITDRERALTQLRQAGHLEFRLVSEHPRLLEQALKGQVPSGYELLSDEQGRDVLVEQRMALAGTALVSADVTIIQGNPFPVVSFKLNREGGREFADLTRRSVGRALAIVLDGRLVSAPTIREPITGGEGIIEGDFTVQQAHDLASVLREPLPAPLVIEEERTVGPTLGKDSIRAGLAATAFGGLLVVAFMVGYYWLAGVMAVIALVLNLLMILGSLGFFHATLTLPGIAGMILTLGMAVDANVLIYERIREELKGGRPLGLAIDAGYDKAFSAIFDSNVTTVIAGWILLSVVSGPIRGFATTLIAGIVASMFTSVFVTRVLFDLLLASGRLTKLPMAHLVRETKVDFIGKRYVCYVLSALVIIAGIVAFLQRGSQRYGIDFTGGLLQEYRFSRPVDADELRTTLAKVGLGDAVIQEFGSPTEWLIRTPDDTNEEIQQTMDRTRETLYADYGQDAAPELRRSESVGPTVGQILRRKAWLAIGWSMVGILVYVAFRFRHFDFGLAGVIALIHDVVVAAGLLCLTARPIDLVIVAALLTIAGFSINDTIVIYDRVRENLRLARKVDLAQVINLSVNQTLGRTLLTSLTVIFEVLALWFFGGEVLHDFAFCLLVGFISGVYSTVYIASAFVITWRRLFKPA